MSPVFEMSFGAGTGRSRPPTGAPRAVKALVPLLLLAGALLAENEALARLDAFHKDVQPAVEGYSDWKSLRDAGRKY